MAHKVDPMRGLAADQSGPREKIQNGDPRSSPNRDQRSGCAESGGPTGSLQKGITGTKEGQIPPHDNRISTADERFKWPDGVSGDQKEVGAFDRAGQTGLLQSPGTTSLKEGTDYPGQVHSLTDQSGGKSGGEIEGLETSSGEKLHATGGNSGEVDPKDSSAKSYERINKDADTAGKSPEKQEEAHDDVKNDETGKSSATGFNAMSEKADAPNPSTDKPSKK